MFKQIDGALNKHSNQTLQTHTRDGGSSLIMSSLVQSSNITPKNNEVPEINEHFFDMENNHDPKIDFSNKQNEESMFTVQEMNEMDKGTSKLQTKNILGKQLSVIIQEDLEGELEGDNESSSISIKNTPLTNY
jgi:hypothetical protein